MLHRQQSKLILLGIILAIIISLILWESNARIEQVDRQMPEIGSVGVTENSGLSATII